MTQVSSDAPSRLFPRGSRFPPVDALASTPRRRSAGDRAPVTGAIVPFVRSHRPRSRSRRARRPPRRAFPVPRARPRTALVPRSNSLARAPRAHLAGSHAQVVNRNVRASPITSSAFARVGRVHGVVATEIAARSRARPRRFAPARARSTARLGSREIFSPTYAGVYFPMISPRHARDLTSRDGRSRSRGRCDES